MIPSPSASPTPTPPASPTTPSPVTTPSSAASEKNSRGIGFLKVKQGNDKKLHISIELPPSLQRLSKEFPYLIESTQKETKTLESQIESIINADEGLKELASKAKNIKLIALSNGTCKIKFKDEKGTIQERTVVQLDPNAAKLFATETMRCKIEKSRVKFEKLAKKFQEPAHRRIAGQYKPEYIMNQNWLRMYNRVSDILKNPPKELTPEAAKSLKFYAIQYLMKVASISQAAEETHKISGSSIRSPRAEYHRFARDSSVAMKLLDSVLLQKLNIPYNQLITLSDDLGFSEVLKKHDNTCGISMTDTDEQIRDKIRASINSKQTSKIADLVLQCELPHMDTFSVEAQRRLQNFSEKMEKILNEPEFSTRNYCLLGLGKIGHHSFAASFGKRPPGMDSIYFDDLKKLATAAGYNPTLQQTARMMAEEIDFTKLPTLAKMDSLPKEKLAMRLGAHTVSNLPEMLKSPTYIQFKKFAAEHPPHSPIGILVANTCANLEGFLNKQYALDKSFSDQGLTLFLKESYARILNCMEVIMHQNFEKDPIAHMHLSSFSDLIFEETLSWLGMCGDVEEADKALQQILHTDVQASAPIRPKACAFTNSGIRCVTAIRKACLAIKPETELKENPNLKILAFDDSYFEVLNALPMAGDEMHKAPAGSDAYFTKPLRAGEPKFNAIFVDPQGAPQTQRETRSHDVATIIENAYEKNAAANPLTVVMDLTTGTLDDKKISNLLEKFKEKIAKGELNIICYRSAQKFDTFGSDKLSGGYIQVYSNNAAFIAKSKDIFSREEQDVDPINRLGLAHLYQNCLKGVETYREATFANANTLFNAIDKSLIMQNNNPPADMPFMVQDRQNCSNYCIMVKGRYEKMITVFFSILKKSGFPLINRPSFGFAFGVLTPTPGGTMRVSVGIEDKKYYEQLAKKMNEFAFFMNSVYKKLSPSIPGYLSRNSSKEQIVTDCLLTDVPKLEEYFNNKPADPKDWPQYIQSRIWPDIQDLFS